MEKNESIKKSLAIAILSICHDIIVAMAIKLSPIIK